VLINFGGGSGAQLLALADELCTAVLARFSIQLEIEPRVYGS
jgi:UDP-N-acetylmuramate dehydrogenase